MEKTIVINAKEKFDFELNIKDMYAEQICVELDEKESKENYYVFNDGNKKIQVIVEVCNFDGYAYIRLYADIANNSNYDIRKSFNAYDSIVLKLYPKNDCSKVFGSSYKIGEKSDCWASYFNSDTLNVNEKRIASLVWMRDEVYYHMLPLCDGAFKGEIKGGDDCLCISCAPYCGGYSKIECKTVVISWGADPYKTAERAVESGFKILSLKKAMTKNTRSASLFDYLGWCSWDSLKLKVNSDGIYEKLDEFKKKKIPLGWVLVDDGWYPENKKRQILSFKEVAEKFPEGLKGFVDKVKNEYQIQNVGIWECYSGGWNGIAPESEHSEEMKDIAVKLPNKMLYPRFDEEGSFKYWNRRHEYLAECGFDFVKIDVECNIETCTHGVEAVGKTANGAHKGMEGSLGLYFDGACINCTGMGQESLWNRPVGMVNRNSADFLYNDVKTMNRFVVDNIYNSYYHSYFSVTDWDMMWSDNETTKMNTVLHAICGGPVYLSDPVGMSNRDVIMPFCLSDGLIVKCDRFAQPTEDRLFLNPLEENLCAKAWNMYSDCGVLGVFNTRETESVITDTFKVKDIKYISGDKFLVYDWFEKKSVICGMDDINSFELKPYDAKLYIIVPFKNDVAILGNTDKYVSCGVVSNVIENGDIYTVIIKEGGNFSFSTEREFEVCVNGLKSEPYKKENLYVVDCKKYSCETVIQIKLA